MKAVTTILLFASFFAAGIQAKSQKDNTPSGYWVTLEQDTIQCEFITSKWKNQPNRVEVRVKDHDTILYPDQIISFSIPSTNTQFNSFKIQPAKYNKGDVQKLGETREPELDKPTVAFLRLLHSGKLKLYSYVDDMDREHFFLESKNGLEELYRHAYLESVTPARKADQYSRQTRMTYFNQYAGILKMAMPDCVDMFAMVDKMDLNSKSLKNVMKKYDQCKN